MEAVAYSETSVYVYTTSYSVPCNHNCITSEVLIPCNICNICQEYRNILSVDTLSSCSLFIKLPVRVYILSSLIGHCEGLFSYKESPKFIRHLREVVSNQDLKGCFLKIHFSILFHSLKWSLTASYSNQNVNASEDPIMYFFVFAK